MLNLSVCHRCKHRQRPCNGPCACLKDGRDIIAHAESGYCPIKKFGAGVEPAGWAEVAAIDVRELPAPQPPAPPDPLPPDRWPREVRMVADLAERGDRGLGDTIERELAGAGETFKRLMKQIGVDCGCTERRAWLNARYPYR